MVVKKTKSAGGVVVNQNGEILVVKQYGECWSMPKGHLEEGETDLDAAQREIFEEGGIKDLVFIKELPSYERYRMSGKGNDDMSELKTIQMFLFKTPDMNLTLNTPEITEARWIPRNEVCDILTHRKDCEFFKSFEVEIE